MYIHHQYSGRINMDDRVHLEQALQAMINNARDSIERDEQRRRGPPRWRRGEVGLRLQAGGG